MTGLLTSARIVGRNGKTIQTIVDESGCVRVRLDNPKNAGRFRYKQLYEIVILILVNQIIFLICVEL